MKNIVLTGFMGTGKTAVGKELASMLDIRLVDVDTEIEKSQGITISDIFRDFGEQHFRDIETETIRSLSERKNSIISTGGGAVLREVNMELLRRNGIVFCLKARPENIYERTRASDDRPLLKVEDPMAKITELLAFRMPFYEKADVVIDTNDKTPRQIAQEIIEVMKCRK